MHQGLVAAHEVGHGLFQLRHTFDYSGIKQGALPDNLMDYSAGNQLSKLQWDLIHDPGLVFGLFETDKGVQMRSFNEKFYDLIQRIRCAVATKRTKIYIPFNKNRSEDFYDIDVDGLKFTRARIEWKTAPASFANISNAIPIGIKSHFIDMNLNALSYDFGSIVIMIPESNKAVFEQLIKSINFNNEYNKLLGYLKTNDNNRSIQLLLNSSYCVYEMLNTNQSKQLIKALADKYNLSEEYEDMVINLIRASNQTLDSKAEKKEIVNFILRNKISPTISSVLFEKRPVTIYESFESGIDNWGGKNNYDTFILELAKLYNNAYSAELQIAQTSSPCIYFDWTHKGSDYLSINNGYIDIRNLVSHGYYRNCDKSEPFLVRSDNFILVRFTDDFTFLSDKDKRMQVMPAFVLRYIIENQIKEKNLNFVNNLMAVFGFTKAVSGLALISDASKLEKIKISWDVLKNTIGLAMTSNKTREYLDNVGPFGRQFSKYWDEFQNIDALNSGVTGITKVFNNDTFWMFTQMTSAWDVISKDPKINDYLNKEKTSAQINNLKIIFNNEGIVY